MCRLVVVFFGLLALVTTWGQRVPQFSNHVVRCAGVYYPRLGCFSRLPPYNNTDRLPADPADVKTNFRLYTRSNPSTPDRLKSDDRSSISGSHMDASLPIKVLIHGFLQNGDMEFLVNMTQALLTHAPANVLVVDWSAGAGFPYEQAVANSRLVGAETALMLREVFDALGARADQVHVIGHSIGAHIAGYVGALVPEISRITGLDPAQPNYSGFDPAVRLDTSDAKFVDVIHTDAEPYTTVKGYGIIEPIGHVDFYPNGGRNQPGCAEEDSLLGLVEDVLSNGITTAEVDLTCSHERSTSLFTSSILQSAASNGRQCHMTSFPCSSFENFTRGECLGCGNYPCPTMGYDAAPSFKTRGVFYLNTTAAYPFCGYHYFVAITMAKQMKLRTGQISLQLSGTKGTGEWTNIDSRRLTGGEVVKKMIISDLDIGEVTQVKLKFFPDSRAKRNQVVLVQKVEVNCPARFPAKYFTGRTFKVRSTGITLSGGDFTLPAAS